MSLGTAKITIQLDSISVSTQTGNVSELGKLPEACAVAIANAIKMLQPESLVKAHAAAMESLKAATLELAEIKLRAEPSMVPEQAAPKSRKYSSKE